MPTWLISVSEIIILITGIISIYLISLNNKWSKWGILTGLLSEPFWIISSLSSKSWGIFSVSIIYTIFYCIGIYNWFFKKNNNKRKK